MTQAAQQVLVAAMQLTESDRAELTDRLLGSIEPANDPEHRAAWESEIEARLADIDAGLVKMIPAADVVQKLRAEAKRSGQTC